MAGYVGIDSADYRKEFTYMGKTHATKGLIGIGVKSGDMDKFKKAHAEAVKSIFKQYALKQERPAYCAAELSAILTASAKDTEEEALTKFLLEMLEEMDEIHLFYTYLFRIEKIKVFWADPDGMQEIPVFSQKKGVTDFYDVISPAYTMYCAWKYCLSSARDNLLLDNFQGKVSPAWHEFFDTAKPAIYYNGDRTNALISSADLLVRLVKLRMLGKNCRFLENEMKCLLPEAGAKVHLHFLGTYYLRKMAPHKRTRIHDVAGFLHHPIYYIIKENPSDSNERAMVEATPAFQALLAKAFEEGASFKFFDKSEDTRFLNPEDVVYEYGERGKREIKSLKALGKRFEEGELKNLI